MKKIIIVLIIAIVILTTVLYFITRRNQTADNEKPLPTGIIIPTQEVSIGELDIVNVSIQDYQKNVDLKTPIELQFSENFTMQDIEFFINPNTPHNSIIEERTLIITPDANWEEGMYYTYSVNFPNEPEKVRIYHFTTTGPAQEFIPDTQPKGAYEQMLLEQKESDTDNYEANNTPYDSATFSVTTQYDPNPPAHFYFKVQLKDQSQGREDFNVWLQTLDLTQEQIDTLDVRFE